MKSASTSKINHSETVAWLQNSPKGRLKYDNGWDQSPNAVFQLVSTVQAEAEAPKMAVLERAMRVFSISEQRSRSFDDNRGSPLGTSSGSGSRISLNELDSDSNGINKNTDRVDAKETDGGKVAKPRRKGLGIREEEYDDEAMAEQFQFENFNSVYDHVAIVLKEFDIEARRKAEENSRKKREEVEADIDKINQKYAKEREQLRRESYQRTKGLLLGITEEEEAKILATVEENRRHRKKQDEDLDLIYDNKLKQVEEARRLANEVAAVESARLAAVRVAADREKEIQVQKLAAQEEERKRLEKEKAARQKKKEQEEHENALKLEAQKLLEQSAKEQSLPPALQGLILKEDCDVYTRCTELLQQYEAATKDIVSSSLDPTLKAFYTGASICINSPLNAVANTDPQQIARKTAHFIDMMDGKPVIGSSSMSVPFQSTALPNGKVFLLRLLAFRFVKKAESEILSEKKGFIPLATIGVTLCKKSSEWATLVRSYFYKLCPFLVPFSFPRGNKTLQEYCHVLGFDLQGEDSSLLNELLGRIKGYCSLYAVMVKTFDKSGPFDIGEATEFFTLGSVWEILTKTMKLEPQPDVTVMVVQTLLELVSDRLQQVYGVQYQKLMHVMITVYLPKIDRISFGASKSGVVRFQTYLEQQFRRPGIR